MSSDFFKIGFKTYMFTNRVASAARSASLGLSQGSSRILAHGVSNSTWIFAGFMYTAQTGLNYRRYKKGKIDKKEFWKRVKMGSVTTVGGVVGGTGGAAAGFAIGTLILPGIGSIIGAVAGGIAGGMTGEKISAKAYKSMEAKMAKVKELKR